MVKSCICSNCGFPHEPGSDRIKPMSKPGKGGKDNNPFAARGRDQFSELVAKVEEKKQRILQRNATDNAAMVRFVHSDNNKLKPVIVRAKSDIRAKSVAPSLAQEVKEEKKSMKKKLKLELCNDYYFAATAVIITLLALVLIRILWNLGGVIATL